MLKSIEGAFADLLRLRKKMDDDVRRPAGPFVAVCGKHYGKDGTRKRFMFIGKATGGDYLPEDGSGINFRSQQKLGLDQLCDPWPSAWWKEIEYFMREYYARIDLNASAAVTGMFARERIAWSNLMKIGRKQGNPSEKLSSEDAELYRDLLNTEIEEFDPTHIMIPTSDYAEDFIKSVFDPKAEGWKELAGRDLMKRRFRKRTVYWQLHPGGKTLELRERHRKLILDDVFEPRD